jgi:hypothetical protein
MCHQVTIMVETQKAPSGEPSAAPEKNAAKSSALNDVRQHVKEFMEATPEEHVK